MKQLLEAIEIVREQAAAKIATRGKDGVYILKYDDAVAYKEYLANGGDPLTLTGFEMLSEHVSVGLTAEQFADFVIAKRSEWKGKLAQIEALTAQAKAIATAAGASEPTQEVLNIIDAINAV